MKVDSHQYYLLLTHSSVSAQFTKVLMKKMGQTHETYTSTRVEFDENGDNGLMIADKYIPEDVLTEIFIRTNLKTLMNCQLVCKRWQMLIQSYVWRKKAERTLGRIFPVHENMSWVMYYLICKKRPFGRNLIKNHSGAEGLNKYWNLLRPRGDSWIVENPPAGVPPLPNTDIILEGKQYCFATSYMLCSKIQLINLEDEGLPTCILDTLQPSIMVSEWYSCRWDCPAEYDCAVQLLGENKKVLDQFHFHDNISGDKQNVWHRMTHEFRGYGPGLKQINFYHSGKDQSFWAGHYGSKMAGACVIVQIPDVRKTTSKQPDIFDDLE